MPKYVADLLEHKFTDFAVSQKSEQFFNKSSYIFIGIMSVFWSLPQNRVPAVTRKWEIMHPYLIPISWILTAAKPAQYSILHKTFSCFWKLHLFLKSRNMKDSR